MTAPCLACTKGLSVEAFCADSASNPPAALVAGCPAMPTSGGTNGIGASESGSGSGSAAASDEVWLPTNFTFNGTYLCGTLPTVARIFVTAWPASARLQFLPAAAGCAGEYTLAGSYERATRTWTLLPAAWLRNPCSYMMVGFRGQFEMVEGRRRFSGEVTGAPGVCTSFATVDVGVTQASLPPPRPAGGATAPPSSSCGTETGRACVFPFTYLGRAYWSCTSVDWSRPWCYVGYPPTALITRAHV